MVALPQRSAEPAQSWHYPGSGDPET